MSDLLNEFHQDSFTNQLINALPCGLLITDEDGTVQAVNSVVESILGGHHTEIVGKGFGKLRPQT